MLDWLFGPTAADARREEDDYDAPETPAPVFAARAFKSALFGTPAWLDEAEFERPRHSADMKARLRTEANGSSSIPSPTKPQGILLTPGTATFRRKTVSFGAGVTDNEGKDMIGKSGVPNDCPGKFPSPFTPKVDEALQPTRRTTLTKTLEAAREIQTEKFMTTKGAIALPALTKSSLDFTVSPGSIAVSGSDAQRLDIEHSKIPKGDAIRRAHPTMDENIDCDITLDLNEPHSQSGRYWKSEYDRYHDEAKAQMTKLVRYKQLAKSYAKKKDSEAVDLGEKLKEEQQRVAEMEAEISELAAQLVNKRLTGRENKSHDLPKDLAGQTALAKECEEQVGDCQAVLQESQADPEQQSKRGSQSHSSAMTPHASNETRQSMKTGRDRIAETDSLRDEIHLLRKSLSMAEGEASRLQDENTELAKHLSRASEELGKSERCRRLAEVQNIEQALLMKTMQKEYSTLKDLAKFQRRDAEGLLKKRHDQVMKLKKEIKSLKEYAVASKLVDADPVISHSRKENDNYIDTGAGKVEKSERIALVDGLMSLDTPPEREHRHTEPCVDYERPDQSAQEGVGALRPRLSTATRYCSHVQTRTKDKENTNIRCNISKTDRSDEKAGVALQGVDCKTDKNIPKHSNLIYKHAALSEVVNYAKTTYSPASQLSASFQERFESLSLNSPGPSLPSPEPSFSLVPNQRMKQKRVADSPRPSMFNIPSSPPKQMLLRARPSGSDSMAQHKDNGPSSRLSSMSSRARIVLPSDRAAAAKARLEQKSAEKRKVREALEGKENVPSGGLL